MSETLQCKKCAAPFEWEKSPKGGQKPVNCPGCRKDRGVERNPEANRARKNARRRAKAAGGVVAGATADLASTELMAIGLSVYPESPRLAAQFVGLAIADAERVAEAARAQHPEIVEGSVEEFGRRSIATLMAIQRNLHTAVLANDIAPRDLPHAGRALSQIHEAIVGKGRQTFGEINMFLVGADGKPFNPNEVPQPSLPVEPDASTKH